MIIDCIIIYSKNELQRLNNVTRLRSYFENNILIDAIYPTITRIPFLDKLVIKSKTRTGNSLMPSEIGVLLSHRKAWRYIITNETDPNKHYLILESDSDINDINVLKNSYQDIALNFDIFFWGAWEGNASIYKSSQKKLNTIYSIGEPFIKSVYCTYGYSLNQSTARLLLKRTQKISYPVDFFKKYINRNELKIGAIKPELISNISNYTSTVRKMNIFKTIKHKLTISIFSTRNNIITFFN
jgi:GR25 family glycosyltransferase involved in LPS biosynthesis